MSGDCAGSMRGLKKDRFYGRWRTGPRRHDRYTQALDENDIVRLRVVAPFEASLAIRHPAARRDRIGSRL